MISPTIRSNVLAIVSAYRKATGSSDSEVSKRFYGNSSFLAKFRRGEHSISTDKVDALVTKFQKEWPEGTDFPMLRPAFMGKRR